MTDVPPPTVPTYGDLVSAEDEAAKSKAAAVTAAALAEKQLTDATQLETATMAALGKAIDATAPDGVFELRADGSVRVFLPAGDGSFHTLFPKPMSTPAPSPA